MGSRTASSGTSANACGKKFHARGYAMRRQYPADQIADAIDSYYSGMSYKQVAEGLEDIYDVPEPSKHTVHDWVKGYTRMALDFMEGKVGPDGTEETRTGERIVADVGDHWVADELFLRGGRRADVLLERDGRRLPLHPRRPPFPPPGNQRRDPGDGQGPCQRQETTEEGHHRRPGLVCGRDPGGVSRRIPSTRSPPVSTSRSTTT